MVKQGEFVAYAMKLNEDAKINPQLHFSTEMSIILELAARLAAAEHLYTDLHKAFIDMQAEMAQIKNDATNLTDGLSELIQKLTKAGYVK